MKNYSNCYKSYKLFNFDHLVVASVMDTHSHTTDFMLNYDDKSQKELAENDASESPHSIFAYKD